MATGRGLRLGEAILGGGVLALGLFIGYETFLLGGGAGNAPVGPRLFPFLIAGGLLVIGAVLLREALAGHVAHERGLELDWRAVALVSTGLIVEMLLMEYAGWIVAAALLFAFTARAFLSRRILVDAGLGLALAILAFVVFNYGLDLGLPGGVIEDMMAPAETDAE
ncbi:C4-dicarboxylate ABC transporter [Skermanella stibiiresistens SB22]|uniref:C4-dicarboxylate ABC transporter n=1 Tax=Skermanella stibiiresistens SB22 TaxID=1385369 RepID=W9GYZ5_9PROT|nr:tripartite tricarboxylate transporter TctB family protein [Skermanella stibiiresistens]EWY37667.1 C4-dicarboxylate ABC transporter [Skermanella stibiiresistens SB22]